MARYLDIDTVLSEEERIPCVFQMNVPGLGFLDPSNDQSYLPAGARVELPLWMARVLKQKNMIVMELPKHFNKKMRDNIAAGALNLNLREYSNYFFEVGMGVAQSLGDVDLRRKLCSAFSSDRYQAVLANALTSTEHDTGELANILTHKEAEIYNAGRHDTKLWAATSLLPSTSIRHTFPAFPLSCDARLILSNFSGRLPSFGGHTAMAAAAHSAQVGLHTGKEKKPRTLVCVFYPIRSSAGHWIVCTVPYCK